jgi:predicted esterase
MPDTTNTPTEHTIETPTHGRYLVSRGAGGPASLLVGFHGYAERAEDELARLRSIPGVDHWTAVSIEGLHLFYRRGFSEVVASWMTRQHRELAIADNIAYVSNVIQRVAADSPLETPIVLTGFSQGVSMAFRAAVHLNRPVRAVIACGGDTPPELDATELARIPAVLIGRGVRDDLYGPEKLASDERRLRAAGVSVEVATLDAAHEWTSEFSQICARFLSGRP